MKAFHVIFLCGGFVMMECSTVIQQNNDTPPDTKPASSSSETFPPSALASLVSMKNKINTQLIDGASNAISAGGNFLANGVKTVATVANSGLIGLFNFFVKTVDMLRSILRNTADKIGSSAEKMS